MGVFAREASRSRRAADCVRDHAYSPDRATRIRGLDGLRALAVMLVFIEHKLSHGQFFGALGVRLFFVLSGFLIVGILSGQRRSIELGSMRLTSALLSFWGKRARRIFPIYYLTLVIILLATPAGSTSIKDGGLLWYFFFLSNYYIAFVAEATSGWSHLWSLSVEQHFYLLSAPIILAIPCVRHRQVTLALLGGAVSVIFIEIIRGVQPFSLYHMSLTNYGFMAFGGYLAVADWKRMGGRTVTALFCCLIASLLFKRAGLLNPSDYFVVLYFVSLLACVSVVAYVVSNQHSTATRLLEWSPLKYLGTISYGFYVYHYFIPNPPAEIDSFSARGLWLVAQFLATVAIAALSWHFIEKPLLRFKTGVDPATARLTA